MNKAIEYPKVFEFDSGKPGKEILLLGAIHGYETCGTEAIEAFMSKLNNGETLLNEGRVTCVPVCNPEAYKQGKEFIDRNLNRMMRRRDPEDINFYEDELANFLCPYMERADVLLDIHSYTTKGGPFVFLGATDGAEFDYANALDVKHMVYGFADAYQNADPRPDLAKNDPDAALKRDPSYSTGTTEYARKFGALALTLEGGQHSDPRAIQVATDAIEKACAHFGIIQPDTPDNAEKLYLKVLKPVWKEGRGQLSQEFENFAKITQGQLLAQYEDGRQIISEVDGYLVMPRASAEPGMEWFYYAVPQDLNTPK